MTDRNQISTVEAPRRGRRLGRRGMAAGALGLVLLGSGAAYAVSQLDNGPTLDGLNCAESMTVDSTGGCTSPGPSTGQPPAGTTSRTVSQIRADAGLRAAGRPLRLRLPGHALRREPRRRPVAGRSRRPATAARRRTVSDARARVGHGRLGRRPERTMPHGGRREKVRADDPHETRAHGVDDAGLRGPGEPVTRTLRDHCRHQGAPRGRGPREQPPTHQHETRRTSPQPCSRLRTVCATGSRPSACHCPRPSASRGPSSTTSTT